MQISFQFNEIISTKAENCEFYLRKKKKKIRETLFTLAKQRRSPFDLTKFLTKKFKILFLPILDPKFVGHPELRKSESL